MKIIKGDLTEATEHWIVHGCNAQGVMGSGVAKALRDKWPYVYTCYKRGHFTIPGTFSIAAVAPDKAVVNLISQRSYGRERGRKYADPEAIFHGLWKFCNFLEVNYPVHQVVASSKIGCSLGGLSWKDDVEAIYKDIETRFDVEFIIYELDQ